MRHMAEIQNVLVETRGRVRIVTINRPEVRNAVDPQTAGALRAAFLAFADDEAVDVAVFTGADGAFCAGYDLKALSASQGASPTSRKASAPWARRDCCSTSR